MREGRDGSTARRAAAVAVAVVLALGVVAVRRAEPVHAAALSSDVLVTTHGAAATSVTSPAFTTAQPGELLVAFITADGPATSAQTIATVTGGGLTWRLRQRTNARAGTSEIWTAAASTVLAGATVRATHAGSYVGSI